MLFFIGRWHRSHEHLWRDFRRRKLYQKAHSGRFAHRHRVGNICKYNNCFSSFALFRNAVDGQLGPKHERLPILHHLRKMRLSRRETRGFWYSLVIDLFPCTALDCLLSLWARRPTARGAAGTQEDRERAHRAEQQAAPSDYHHAMRRTLTSTSSMCSCICSHSHESLLA